MGTDLFLPTTFSRSSCRTGKIDLSPFKFASCRRRVWYPEIPPVPTNRLAEPSSTTQQQHYDDQQSQRKARRGTAVRDANNTVVGGDFISFSHAFLDLNRPLSSALAAFARVPCKNRAMFIKPIKNNDLAPRFLICRIMATGSVRKLDNALFSRRKHLYIIQSVSA